MANLLITGTRFGRSDVERELNNYIALFGAPDLLILCGDKNGEEYTQRGVDKQARKWRDLWFDIGASFPVETIYADWDEFGDSAGPFRNELAVDVAGRGAHCLGFPTNRSKGTWNCIRHATKQGLLAVIVQEGWIEELKRLISGEPRRSL